MDDESARVSGRIKLREQMRQKNKRPLPSPTNQSPDSKRHQAVQDVVSSDAAESSAQPASPDAAKSSAQPTAASTERSALLAHIAAYEAQENESKKSKAEVEVGEEQITKLEALVNIYEQLPTLEERVAQVMDGMDSFWQLLRARLINKRRLALYKDLPQILENSLIMADDDLFEIMKDLDDDLELATNDAEYGHLKPFRELPEEAGLRQEVKKYICKKVRELTVEPLHEA